MSELSVIASLFVRPQTIEHKPELLAMKAPPLKLIALRCSEGPEADYSSEQALIEGRGMKKEMFRIFL